jgi:peroxiredoxin
MRELPAPEIVADEWLNTSAPIRLGDLQGRVVVIYAFQQRCEGCVQHALPQAKMLDASFSKDSLVVLGLHCPFETSSRSGRAALESFLAEQGITFPVAMDRDAGVWQPVTFSSYGMQGTPTLVLIGGNGKRRLQRLGHMEDEHVVEAIQTLLSEQD